MQTIRLLIVDDSAIIRRALVRAFEPDRSIEVVGTARDGVHALAAIERLQPDVVTLDLEMPELDGLGVLRELRRRRLRVPVVMFSMLTERGGRATLDALALGAADYVTKPTCSSGFEDSVEQVRDRLLPKLHALAGSSPTRASLAEAGARVVNGSGSESGPGARRGPIEAVLIGVSTGGPQALQEIVPRLELEVPVLIVQHMPAMFTRLLAERLDRSSRLDVLEGADGLPLGPGQCAIAPGGQHMTVRSTPDGLLLGINRDAPEHSCRPAVDILFRSAARALGGRCLAAVLTGMGADGAVGAALLRDAGATVFAQDRATSVVWGMPGAVVKVGAADRVLPLERIAPSINEAVRSSRGPLRRRA